MDSEAIMAMSLIRCPPPSGNPTFIFFFSKHLFHSLIRAQFVRTFVSNPSFFSDLIYTSRIYYIAMAMLNADKLSLLRHPSFLGRMQAPAIKIPTTTYRDSVESNPVQRYLHCWLRIKSTQAYQALTGPSTLHNLYLGRGQELDNYKGAEALGAEDSREHSLKCESIMGDDQKQLASPHLELAEQFFACTSHHARGLVSTISTVGATNTGGLNEASPPCQMLQRVTCLCIPMRLID